MSFKGVRARNSSIQIEFSYQGLRCRETLRMAPTKSNLETANRKRQTILYQIEIGTFNYIEHFPNSPKAKKLSKNSGDYTTIKLALNEWLIHQQKTCSKSTIRDYVSAISYHLEPIFGDMRLTELKPSDVKDWIISLPISNKRINNILTPLRGIYKNAYENEEIKSNPMDRVKNLPKKTREPEPFSLNEISKILSQLDGQAHNLIKFAFWSGLRTSELIALNWKDIDLEKEVAHIRRAKVRGILKETKTSAGMRTVRLQPEALIALKSQKAFTTETVFHDPRYNTPTLNDQNIRKVIWTPALKNAEVKYREPYQTRHTFASMMLNRGENPMWVAHQLGHSNPSQTFKTYARWINI